jgi:hypothetical protein
LYAGMTDAEVERVVETVHSYQPATATLVTG